MDKRITGRMSDGTPFVLPETGNEEVGYITTQRRLPEIITKLAKLEDKIENGDLIEVVRCKDCKHLMFSDFYGECRNNHLGIVKPWDYCSHGERKE